MKFRFKIFSILIMCLFSSCYTGKENSKLAEKKITINQNSSKEDKIAEFNESVFCLSVTYPISPKNKHRAIGTAFLVSENLFATAFHVKSDLEANSAQSAALKGNIIAWKKFDNGDYIEIPINLANSDKDSDIALYKFDAENFKQQIKSREILPFALAERLPNLGEDVLAIGYHSNLELPFNSLGNVSMIDNSEDIYADMTLLPGNSGGPLISMKTGEVLGINIKVMTMGDGTIRLGIAKKSSKLKELIEKSKS